MSACAASTAQAPEPASAPAAASVATEPVPAEPAPPAAPAEAPAPELTFPEEQFRAQQPAAGDVKSLKTPELGRFSLPGGITVYLVERHNLPIVSVSLVFEGGSRVDPKGKDGLASVCAGLMSEGTEKLDKLAFEEVQADLASSVSSGASDEQHFVAMNTLKKNFPATLDLWADTLLRPGMRQDELDRNLKRRIAGLAQLKGNAQAVAGRLTNSVVYGPDHVFGRFSTEASYEAMKLDDCKKFLADYIKPQGAKLFVVGDTTKDELTKELGPRLKDWRGSPKAIPSLGRVKARDGKIFFVDIPGAPQSVVQMMHLGPPRKAPDFHPTSIMSAILGGGFTSRLNMNIREKHGYAYGAGSGFSYHRAGSTFRASASVRTDVTKESILEMLKEVRGLRDGDPTEAEVTREKDGKILALPAQFSTGGSTLGAFRDLIYYGLPLNYFDSYVPKVKAVDVGAVKRAATRYLKPGELRLLVVGDGKTVLPKLKELGDNKDLAGKIVILDPDGNLVTSEAAASNAN
jgi:predicted Zn-dependent peptidase